MRLIYHSRDTRIETHIFLSVLAYHAVHLIGTQLKQYHIHSSWATLQFELNQWQRITMVLPKEGRTCILLKRDADPGPFQRRITTVMGLQSNQTYTRRTQHDPKTVVS